MLLLIGSANISQQFKKANFLRGLISTIYKPYLLTIVNKKSPDFSGLFRVVKRLLTSFFFNSGFFTGKTSKVENTCSTYFTSFINFNFL